MEMSKKGLGTVAVTDCDQKLVGILTDGDLRRAIEKHADLYGDIIDSIMTKKPKFIYANIFACGCVTKIKKKAD